MLLKAQNSITRVGNFSPKKNIFGGEYTRSLFICNVSLKPKLVYISKSGFSSEDRTPISRNIATCNKTNKQEEHQQQEWIGRSTKNYKCRIQT